MNAPHAADKLALLKRVEIKKLKKHRKNAKIWIKFEFCNWMRKEKFKYKYFFIIHTGKEKNIGNSGPVLCKKMSICSAFPPWPS